MKKEQGMASKPKFDRATEESWAALRADAKENRSPMALYVGQKEGADPQDGSFIAELGLLMVRHGIVSLTAVVHSEVTEAEFTPDKGSSFKVTKRLQWSPDDEH